MTQRPPLSAVVMREPWPPMFVIVEDAGVAKFVGKQHWCVFWRRPIVPCMRRFVRRRMCGGTRALGGQRSERRRPKRGRGRFAGIEKRHCSFLAKSLTCFRSKRWSECEGVGTKVEGKENRLKASSVGVKWKSNMARFSKIGALSVVRVSLNTRISS